MELRLPDAARFGKAALMKRWVPLFALVTVAACNGEAEPDPVPTVTATPTPAVTASATASSNGARSVAEETDDFLFEYSYPAEAGRIVELATLLDIQLQQRREELASDSGEARREAREDGFPYNKHSYEAEWEVVADLPGWLSLSADIATYTGGAHGNSTVESLVWDKQAEEAMEAKRLFTSPAALEEAFGDRFCKALEEERRKRRGDSYEEGGDNSFNQCPGIEELEILVGSSNGRTFNRLTVYAGPYVAGPYAEGAYEVDLSIDDGILAVVKPKYREAFGARN
jgi:hypothetical protein